MKTPRSKLLEFAYFPEIERRFEDIAVIAQEEPWDHSDTLLRRHSILQNYLERTYEKLEEEKNIAYTASREHACFNTGLLTKNREDIFLLFQTNKHPTATSPYYLTSVQKESDVLINRYFSGRLPDPADYFQQPELLICNPHLPLTVDYDHIIDENIIRFPEPLRGNRYALRNLVKGAIEYTMKLVRNNYRTAVPQYFNGHLQILLPLYLTDPHGPPDLALALYREEGGYVGRTCLTMKMAYQNARVIVRPDAESWLKP